MSEISFEDLAAGLRGWARGSTAHEQAAAELLIWHETWLRRPDFKSACITQRAAGLVAIINWEEAREFIERGCTQRGHPELPASSSQRRLLDFAVALGENMFGLSSMGAVHRWHMATAFAKAAAAGWKGPYPSLATATPASFRATRNVRGMRPGGQGRGPHPAGRIMTRQQAGQAPGIVKIRPSGADRDVAMVAALLTGYDGCGIDVIEQSAPYPNRRDPGERVYLTVRIGPGERS